MFRLSALETLNTTLETRYCTVFQLLLSLSEIIGTMKQLLFTACLILTPIVFYAQSDCAFLGRCKSMIGSYFPYFEINNDTFRLKTNWNYEMAHHDNFTAESKAIDLPKLLQEKNQSCKLYNLLKSFPSAYKNIVIQTLPMTLDSINTHYNKHEYFLAIDYCNNGIRMINSYNYLSQTDTTFNDSKTMLLNIRKEIEKIDKEETDKKIMQINQTMSRPITLTEALEMLIYKIKNQK